VYGGDTIMKKLLAHRGAPIPSLVEQASSLPSLRQAGSLSHVDPIFQKMVAKLPGRSAAVDVSGGGGARRILAGRKAGLVQPHFH